MSILTCSSDLLKVIYRWWTLTFSFILCLIHVHAFITKLLSTWLLILLSVFSVGEVWSQHLSHLGTQLKVWLVHKHSSCLGMQLKDAVYKNLCSLTKFIISSAVMALAVSLSWHERGKSCGESEGD